MSPDAKDPAIATYETHTDTLLQRYDAVATMDILSPVLDLLLPHAPVLDIGAGSGRDAAWLVAHGHPVTAVEPVAGFRAAIASRVPDATVVDARLPDLDGVVGPFGLILTNAVWHHLTEAQRSASVAQLSGLLAPNGRLVLSLRHGAVSEGQPIPAVDPEAEIARAVLAGLKLLRRTTAPSHQPGNIAAGITWTWLVFEKEA